MSKQETLVENAQMANPALRMIVVDLDTSHPLASRFPSSHIKFRYIDGKALKGKRVLSGQRTQDR